MLYSIFQKTAIYCFGTNLIRYTKYLLSNDNRVKETQVFFIWQKIMYLLSKSLSFQKLAFTALKIHFVQNKRKS